MRLYSRRLEDITESFPEVASSVSRAKGNLILDGEVVPFSGGHPLPFQLLQRRLRRIEGFEAAKKKAPVTYFVFDILYREGEEKVGLALTERRSELSAVMKNGASLPIPRSYAKPQRSRRDSGGAGNSGTRDWS